MMKKTILTKTILLSAVVFCSLSANAAIGQSIPQSDTLRKPSAIPAPGGLNVNKAQERKSIEFKDLEIGEALKVIAERFSMSLGWSRSLTELSGKKVSLKASSITAQEALDRVFANLPATGRVSSDGQTIVIAPISQGNKEKVSESQDVGSVKGRIVDSISKSGVEGVTITFDKVNIRVITDKNGEFEIPRIPTGSYSYTVRMLGYKTVSGKTVVTGQAATNIRVTIVSTASSLQEVVTTATGQARRVEVPHDIAKIDAAKVMERTPVRNVTDLIEAAQIPGVLVQRQSGDPGSPTKIRIRGLGSISESNDPVVVIDGVWAGNVSGRPSRIDELDPAIIETVEVVRGASAATLYGQDAANGVIVITTKRGRPGPTRWNFGYNRDWGETYGRKPLEYVGMGHDVVGNLSRGCNIRQMVNYECIQDSVIIHDPNNRLLSREGTMKVDRYTFAVEGGNQMVRYNIGINSSNERGVRKPTDLNMIRYRIIGFDVKNEMLRPSNLSKKGINSMITLDPNTRTTITLGTNGSYSDLRDNQLVGSFYLPLTGGVNIIDTTTILLGRNTVRREKRPSTATTILASANVRYQPAHAWVFNSNIGIEKADIEQTNSVENTHCTVDSGCKDTIGSATFISQDRRILTFRANLSGVLNTGRISRFLELRPSIGMDFRRTDGSNMNISREKIPPGESMSQGGELIAGIRTQNASALAGWYASTTIGLFRKLYFDVGVRQDVGSAIVSSSNTNYPKLGTSWLVSDEGFWRENSLLQMLRLRGAIGYAAVQPDAADITGDYRTTYRWVDGRYVEVATLVNVGNRGLVPERAMEMELGFEAAMLGDRLDVVANYAKSTNKNTLIRKGTAPSAGGSSRKENIAKVLNNNVELSVIARAIEMPDLRVTVNYGLTLSTNKVARLGNRTTPSNVGNVGRVEAGYPLAGIWSRAVLGYEDVDGNGLIDSSEVIMSDSLVYLGWSQPKYRASYGASVTLRNNLVFDTRLSYQSRYVQSYLSTNTYALENINAPLGAQALALIKNLDGRKSISDLRWNSASITYHLPARISALLRTRSASVSLQGSNLNLWTSYIGRDPGVNSELSGEVPSDDGVVTPMPRKFVLDFRIGF